MKGKHEPAGITEKDRVRLQIQAQVDEFLRDGGKIELLNNANAQTRAVAGRASTKFGESVDFSD